MNIRKDQPSAQAVRRAEAEMSAWFTYLGRLTPRQMIHFVCDLLNAAREDTTVRNSTDVVLQVVRLLLASRENRAVFRLRQSGPSIELESSR